MDVMDVEAALGPLGLGVHASDEVAVVQHRQRVVTVHALRTRRVHLDPVVEAEEPGDAGAMPQQRIEWRQQRRPARARASLDELPGVARQRQPAVG
jgi:hypothetical protein